MSARTHEPGRGAAGSLLEGTKYKSLGVLGRGGMGEVHLAEHLTLGKIVVVKLLHRELTARPELVDRMRLEGQALARLSHPALVAVLDHGETARGQPYLVMERLLGRTLKEELAARGFLPVAEALAIARQMLDGLAAVHAIGLVHRDIKSDNVFLCDNPGGSPIVKLIDFGIAKVLPEAPAGRAPAPLVFATEEGTSIGTPRFFSPEQARGKSVDARADLYSVGVVLYSLVAGRGPFDHCQNMVDLVTAHAKITPEPPSAYARQPIPAELDRAILRALAKEPSDRFGSARELADALAAIPIGPPPQRADEATQVLPTAGVLQPPSAPAPTAQAGVAARLAPSPAALAARGTVRMDPVQPYQGAPAMSPRMAAISQPPEPPQQPPAPRADLAARADAPAPARAAPPARRTREIVLAVTILLVGIVLSLGLIMLILGKVR